MADRGRDKAQKAPIDFFLEIFINGPPHLCPSVILAVYDFDDLGGQKAKPEVLTLLVLSACSRSEVAERRIETYLISLWVALESVPLQEIFHPTCHSRRVPDLKVVEVVKVCLHPVHELGTYRGMLHSHLDSR